MSNVGNYGLIILTLHIYGGPYSKQEVHYLGMESSDSETGKENLGLE